MGASKAAAKVGAVVILALLTLGYLSYFFFGRSVGGYPVDVSFRDAQGIAEQAEVLMAGVKIGAVHDVRLDEAGRRAVVRLMIQSGRDIPLGSSYTISSGGLLGELAVMITPPDHPVEGTVPRTPGDPPLLEGKDLVTLDDLKEQVAEIGEGSRLVLENLQTATGNLARITGDPVLSQALQNAARNTERATATADRIATEGLQSAAEVRAMVRRLSAFLEGEEPVLRATLAHLESTARQGEPLAEEAQETIRSARALVDDLRATSEFIRDTLDDTLAEAEAGPALNRALKNLADASEEFRVIAVNARKISDDLAGTGEDTSKVGAAVSRVGAVAEKADRLLEQISGVTERASRKRGRLINGGAEVSVLQRVGNDSRFRADASMTFDRNDGSAILFGLRDIGDGNRLDLQSSMPALGRAQLRYGFIGSRLGLGADWMVSRHPARPPALAMPGSTTLSLDLYDPNNTQVDLYGRHQVSDKMGVVFGVEDLFDRGYPTLGLTYRP